MVLSKVKGSIFATDWFLLGPSYLMWCFTLHLTIVLENLPVNPDYVLGYTK